MAIHSRSPTDGCQGAQVPAVPEGSCPINNLPTELLMKIFGCLPFKDSCRLSSVCSLWDRVVKEIPDPTLRVFGPSEWKKYFNYDIKEEDLLPLPQGLDKYSRAIRCRLVGKEEPPTCSVIFMPKGLTLYQIEYLMQKPVEGYRLIRFHLGSWGRIFEKLRDKAIENSYWFMITNGVIEGSRNLSYEDQKNLVNEITESEWEVPTFLKAVVCSVMHYVSSGKYLFGTFPLTYTRCQDEVDNMRLVVGGFDSGGLCVSKYTSDNVCYGVAACRQLPS